MKASRFILLTVITLCASAPFALGQKTTKYSNEFMNLGAGARSFGMGNAVVATTDDVTSGYWNPAGLTSIKSNIELSFMHSEYFAGVAKYDYLGFAAKLDDKSAFGITALRFGVDGILNTINLIENGQINYDNVSTFSAADYGILLSYARKAKFSKYRDAYLSYGFNGKIIHRKAGDFARAWGFGIDVAGKMDLGKSNWELGLTVKDITSTFNSWTFNFSDKEQFLLAQTGNYPTEKTLEVTLPRIIFGAAKTFEWNKIDLLAELDLDITTDGKRNTLLKTNLFSVDPHLGLEGKYKLSNEKNALYLRTGIYNIQRESNEDGKKITSLQPSIGVGIKIGQAKLDYAFTDLGNASSALYSHVFSINFSITQSDD